MTILEDIQQLKKTEVDQGILTIYLNTDPSDPDQRGGKWRTTLKNGLHQLETSLADDKEALKDFRSLKKEVEQYAFEHERQLKRSMIIFATADGSLSFFEQFHIRVTSEFHYDKTPHLTQLKELMKTYEKSGIILVQHDEISVLETFLNRSEHVKAYEKEIETEDWKEKVGPRKPYHSSGKGSYNAQIDNFEARFKANQQRWYKSVAGRLDKLAKDSDWQKIYIVGETEVAHELNRTMTREVEKVIDKNMLGQPDEKIVEAVFG